MKTVRKTLLKYLYMVNVQKFQTLVASKKGLENSADPDQTASEEAV